MSPTVHAVGGGERGGEKVVSPAAFHPQCFAAQPSLCISRVRRQKLITLPVLPGGGITIYKSGVLLTQHLPHPQAVISSTQKGLWWCRWSFPQGGPISDSLQISAWGAHPHFQQLNWRHSHLEESNTEWRHCQKADMENAMTWKSETEQWWEENLPLGRICLVWQILQEFRCTDSQRNQGKWMERQDSPSQTHIKKIIRAVMTLYQVYVFYGLFAKAKRAHQAAVGAGWCRARSARQAQRYHGLYLHDLWLPQSLTPFSPFHLLPWRGKGRPSIPSQTSAHSLWCWGSDMISISSLVHKHSNQEWEGSYLSSKPPQRKKDWPHTTGITANIAVSAVKVTS